METGTVAAVDRHARAHVVDATIARHSAVCGRDRGSALRKSATCDGVNFIAFDVALPQRQYSIYFTAACIHTAKAFASASPTFSLAGMGIFPHLPTLPFFMV